MLDSKRLLQTCFLDNHNPIQPNTHLFNEHIAFFQGLASAQQLLQSSVSEVEEVKERAAQELYQLDARLKKTIDDHWDEATRLDGALTSLVAQAELEAVAARQRVNKAVEDAVRDKDTTIAELERAVEEAAEECKRKVRELTARMKTEREEPAIAPGSVLVQDQDMERKLGEANAEISALNKRVVALDVALAESTAACDTQRRRSEMITSEHTEELENMRRAHEIRLSELEEEAARITARAAAAEDAASVAAEETARGKLAFEEARKRDTLLAAELHARDVMEKVADAEAQMRAKLEAVAAAQLAVATARQQAEACVIAASLREAEDELKTSHTKFKVVVAAAKEKGDIKSKLMLARHEAKEHAEEFQQCKSALTNALNELEAREVELVEEHIAKTTLEATKETLSTQLNSLLDRFKALAATACAEERTKRTQLEDSTCMLQQQTKEIESLETEVACLRSRAHESQVAMTQVKDSLDGVSSKLETVQVAAAQERARLVAAALASLHQLRAHLTAQHGLRLQPTVQLASKRQSQLSAMLALTPTPLASRFQPPIPPPRVSAPAPARRCIVGQGGGTPRIDFDKSRAQSMGRPNTAIDGYDALPSRMVRAPAACACACINSGMDDDGEPFLPVLATAGFADAARNPSSALCNQWAARVLPASYHPALRRADWHSHHPVEQRAARAISLSARGMTSQSGSRAST